MGGEDDLSRGTDPTGLERMREFEQQQAAFAAEAMECGYEPEFNQPAAVVEAEDAAEAARHAAGAAARASMAADDERIPSFEDGRLLERRREQVSRADAAVEVNV